MWISTSLFDKHWQRWARPVGAGGGVSASGVFCDIGKYYSLMTIVKYSADSLSLTHDFVTFWGACGFYLAHLFLMSYLMTSFSCTIALSLTIHRGVKRKFPCSGLLECWPAEEERAGQGLFPVGIVDPCTGSVTEVPSASRSHRTHFQEHGV